MWANRGGTEMDGRRKRSSRTARVALSLGLVVALVGACGSSGSKKGSSTTDKPKSTGSVTTSPQTTDLGPGVTADTIKLGVVMVDYSSIADFVDFTRGDQKQAYQIFIDDINKNGGVGGRKIEPVFQTVRPDREHRADQGVHDVDRGREGVRHCWRAHRLHRCVAAVLHEAAQLAAAHPRADATHDRRIDTRVCSSRATSPPNASRRRRSSCSASRVC